ncbi:MAG: exo-alpha-sialidase [Ignavibacteriales bacterium]|nr:exo-alpha-sialidase [Ignavibacteriales bacterium]
MKIHLQICMVIIVFVQGTICQNNWEALPGPNGGDFHSITCFNDKLYAGTDAAGMIFESADFGNSWKKHKHANEEINHIAANETGIKIAGKIGALIVGDTIYKIDEQHSIYRSTDGGKAWYYLNSYQVGTGKFITIDDSGSLYVVSDERVVKLRKHGTEEGTVFYFGDHTTKINSLLFNSDGTIYLTVNGLFKKSTDYGVSWKTINVEVDEIKRLLDSKHYGILASTTNGIFRSTDKGETWKSIGLSGHTVNECTIDSKGNIYASTWVGIFKCTNIVDPQWTMLPATSMLSFDFEKDSNGVLYAATAKGLRFSHDNGITWKFVEQGYYEITALALDHKDHLFFGSMGIGRYTLPLTELSQIDTIIENKIGNAVFGTSDIVVSASNTIYASIYYTVLKSNDEGLNWKISGPIINTPFPIYAYGLTVTENDEVFAAYGSQGIYAYNSQLDKWEQRSNGIELKDIHALLSDSSGRLHCGNWNGLYYSDNKGMS